MKFPQTLNVPFIYHNGISYSVLPWEYSVKWGAFGPLTNTSSMLPMTRRTPLDVSMRDDTHSVSGQNGGWASRRPFLRNVTMSQLSTSGYGPTPRVISSHSTTPYDHWTVNNITHTRPISNSNPLTPIICDFWHPGTLTIRAERQSAWASKNTNDGLTQSGTGCFIKAATHIGELVGNPGCKLVSN